MSVDTRKSLEDEVLSWLDESGDTSTTRTNVRNALLQSHHQRVTEDAWSFMLWYKPLTFNLVAGQTTYPLHSEFARALYFRNVTQGVPLRERSFRHLVPSQTDERNRFVLGGRSPTAQFLTSASTLSMVSSNAGDTAGRGLYIRGETADGVLEETIVANGLTPVVSVNTYLPGGLLQMTKFGTWAGKMTLTGNAGAVTNLVLLAAETGRSYQQLRTLWTPDALDQIEYLFYRNPNPLNYDESVPDIPFPHSRILVWDALLKFAAYDGQMDPMRVQEWTANQSRMDLTMRQAFLEGQTIGAEPQGVLDIEE